MTSIQILVLILAVIAVIAAIAVNRIAPKVTEDSAPMSRRTRATLVTYFLLLSATLIYLIVRLYQVDFPDSPIALNAAAGDPDVTALSQGDGPVLFYAFPHLKAGSTAASAPTYELGLYGDRFEKNALVRVNGQERPVKAQLDDNLIRVVPESADMEGVGSLAIEVMNPGKRLSNTLHVVITRPKMHLNGFWFEWTVTRETQLILLVLAAGALGSFIHALKSLADFIGNRTAQSSWFWWYISRPFLGATLAFTFYSVLRGGFLTGTPADVEVVNPFGAVAVAALVGMFADKATHKLAEVFETLFKADDRRAGKLAGPVADKLSPATVRAGASQSVEIKISGERLAKATAVKVNGVDRPPERVEEKQVVVKLLPADIDKPKTITLAVVTPDGTTPAATLRVSDLEITTTALPKGKVGDAYSQTLTSTGGTPPHKWSIEGAPAGLALDEKTGTINGKPTTPGASQVEVTVTDKVGASNSHTFEMNIEV
jgi:hypothetical protein